MSAAEASRKGSSSRVVNVSLSLRETATRKLFLKEAALCTIATCLFRNSSTMPCRNVLHCDCNCFAF